MEEWESVTTSLSSTAEKMKSSWDFLDSGPSTQKLTGKTVEQWLPYLTIGGQQENHLKYWISDTSYGICYMTKQLISKMSYMTPSKLGHQNNAPSSSMQVVAFQNLSSNKQWYQQSSLKKQQKRRLPYQWPLENMWMYSPRKPLQNYHPLNLIITPLNSRTRSYPNKLRLIHWTPLNIKPARGSLKNTSRQEKFPLSNPLKPYHSSLSKKMEARKLHPCQDYQYLNSHTIKNTYPLPLISNLVNKLWESLIFIKFDMQ